MSSSQTQSLCALCANTGHYICKTCRSIHYCSAECQRVGWPSHKLFCKEFSKSAGSPCPDNVRAVYFPEKGDRPRLVWVHVLDRHVTGEPGSKLKVDCSGLDITADRMKALQEWTIIKNSRILRCDIPHITWIGSFKYDGHVSGITGDNNTSVAAIDKELPLAMYGPLLFYALDRDLDATDCQNLVDDIRWRDYTRYHIVGPTSDFTLLTVQSVMANCLGDTPTCHQPDFAPYPLPAETLRQDNRALLELPIGALIGIPLVAVNMKRPGLPWRGRMNRDVDCTMLPPEKNRLLANIHPGMDKVQSGSLIVARKDEKPLLVVHVMALCRYCKYINDDVPLPIVRESDTSRSENDECFRKRWELLKAKATPEGFRASWEACKEVKQACKGTFKDIASPYDM